MCRPAVTGWLGAMYIRLNRIGAAPFWAASSNPTKFKLVALAVVVLAAMLSRPFIRLMAKKFRRIIKQIETTCKEVRSRSPFTGRPKSRMARSSSRFSSRAPRTSSISRSKPLARRSTACSSSGGLFQTTCSLVLPCASGSNCASRARSCGPRYWRPYLSQACNPAQKMLPTMWRLLLAA